MEALCSLPHPGTVPAHVPCQMSQFANPVLALCSFLAVPNSALLHAASCPVTRLSTVHIAYTA